MIRVAVCIGDSAKARTFFEQTQESVKALNNRVELSFIKDANVVTKKISVMSYYYDVFILDSENEESLMLAQNIRNYNLNASLIFVIHNNIKQILRIIKYRPSQIVSEEADKTEQLVALKYCINEQKRCKSYFTVKTRDTVLRINYDNILFFESNQRKVILHTTKQIIEFYGKLGEVLSLLPQDRFVRSHQSYVIYMPQILSLDKANRLFKLTDGTLIEISKSYYGDAVIRYEAFTERF